MSIPGNNTWKRVRGARPIIGTVEWVEVPKWEIAVRARTDTGALTSALHVENLERHGRTRLTFDVVSDPRDPSRRRTVTASLLREGRVRSSNGISELRPFIRMKVQVGALTREIEVGLLDRGRMRHRMLLGRKALQGMLVDPDHRFLLSAEPERSRKTKKSGKKLGKKAPRKSTSQKTPGKPKPGKKTTKRPKVDTRKGS